VRRGVSVWYACGTIVGNLALSLLLHWFLLVVLEPSKVGQPRMEEVEVKGKKQMMFLGLPTYEGSLRFADVSHLQSVGSFNYTINNI